MGLPRLRQLRRDKLLFTLALNTVRLHLEEADRIALAPHLREAPDEDLQLIQHHLFRWVDLSTTHIMHKYHCALPAALELLGELQNDLKRNISLGELRQVPLQGAPHVVPMWEPEPAAPASGSPEGEG
jgi:hypothetical protein